MHFSFRFLKQNFVLKGISYFILRKSRKTLGLDLSREKMVLFYNKKKKRKRQREVGRIPWVCRDHGFSSSFAFGGVVIVLCIKMFSCMSGLYPLDVSSILFQLWKPKNASRHCQMSSRGRICPFVENQWSTHRRALYLIFIPPQPPKKQPPLPKQTHKARIFDLQILAATQAKQMSPL